jgi:hypothetical protein
MRIGEGKGDVARDRDMLAERRAAGSNPLPSGEGVAKGDG